MIAALNVNPSLRQGVRKNIYKTALASLYDKKKLWKQLSEERHFRQKSKEIEKSRFTFYKKIYTIDNVKYYKVEGMERDYYIQVDSLNYVPSSKFVIQLCYYTINGMKCKRSLLKIDKDKNTILVSESTLRIAFQSCVLESIR